MTDDLLNDDIEMVDFGEEDESCKSIELDGLIKRNNSNLTKYSI